VVVLAGPQSCRLSASNNVLVARYMEGGDLSGGNGDPSMSLVVPTRQFRMTHRFFAAANWSSNFATIVAPAGATVTLDGTDVSSAFTAVRGSGYGIAILALSNAGAGAHTVSASAPVGVYVYGYGPDSSYTSYMYPAGLSLAK
jgi:hypothetical protein